MRVHKYIDDDASDWDKFCAQSSHSTFLHTRKFINYHNSKFKDLSLIITDDNFNWMGIFPAAEDITNNKTVISHPGITYGGMIHCGELTGKKMLQAINLVCNQYYLLGYERLIYKSIPHFYHQSPSEDDLYALFMVGAKLIRSDLCSVINLQKRLRVSNRRVRSLKKARKNNLEIKQGVFFLEDYWSVLIENLKIKHNVNPVHTIEEMKFLVDTFPNNIICLVAYHNDIAVAGIILFVTNNSYHAQYIASNLNGYELSALDLVFDYAIADAIEKNKNWFSFGSSTENSGRKLNTGLYDFKTEFGAGGILNNFYEIDLNKVS